MRRIVAGVLAGLMSFGSIPVYAQSVMLTDVGGQFF